MKVKTWMMTRMMENGTLDNKYAPNRISYKILIESPVLVIVVVSGEWLNVL